MFRGSVKSIGYPLHSPVSPSLPLPVSPCAITFQLESMTTSEEQLQEYLSRHSCLGRNIRRLFLTHAQHIYLILL